MLDDLKERTEQIRKERKEAGIKQIWVTQKTIERAREAKEWLDELGLKLTVPEIVQVALEDFMAENAMMTKEEVDDFVKELDEEKIR